MKTITAYIKRHPVLAYYALVFTISWGGILFAAGLVLANSRLPRNRPRYYSPSCSWRCSQAPAWRASR